MTSHPFDSDGFMVACSPGSEQNSYTAPESLGENLAAGRYRLHPELVVTSKEDREAAETVAELIDDRTATFRNLLEEQQVDVAHCTIFSLKLPHQYFWRVDSSHEVGKHTDKHVDSIHEKHPGATLFLLSDHGCAEIATSFYKKAWIEHDGFLRTIIDASSAFEQFGINKKSASKFGERIGVRGVIAMLTSEFVDQQSGKGSRTTRRILGFSDDNSDQQYHQTSSTSHTRLLLCSIRLHA